MRITVIVLILVLLTACTNTQDVNKENNVEDANASSKQQESVQENNDITDDNTIKVQIGKKVFDLNSKLSYEDVQGLDDEELAVLRNSYYAKIGYTFKNSTYTEVFSKYSWYNPIYDDVEIYLSDEDKLNINLILKTKSKWEDLYDVLNEQEDLMIGFWQKDSPGMAAGYNDVFKFESDRTFVFNENQMDGEERVRTLYGNWYIVNQKLYLHIKSRDVVIGGELVPATGSIATDYEIEGGVLIKVNLEERYIEVYQLDFNQENINYSEDCFGVLMDDQEFYNLGKRNF